MTSAAQKVFEKQKENFFSSDKNLSWRRAKLAEVATAIKRLTPKLCSALRNDLGRNETETEIAEIFPILAEIKYLESHLEDWMQPQAVSTPLFLFPARSEIRLEPKGNVLVISPWNYPFDLAMNPIISAVAAGNNVILKPSEFTPHTNEVIGSILNECFRSDEVTMIEGDAAVAAELLDLPFDHIFFTGSTLVGRSVMEKAAKHLTPVTLELGGKCPVLVDYSANLDTVARRVAWGKFFNAGQTCIAPDFVLAPKGKGEILAEKILAQAEAQYGGGQKRFLDFCRIINERHWQRIDDVVRAAVAGGAKEHGGFTRQKSEKLFAPLVLSNLAMDSAIMQEEIFGPVLPIVEYDDFPAIVDRLRKMPKPLVAYYFGEENQNQERFLKISAGASCLNDVLIHFSNPHLPFGGIGRSGMGSYHGFFGFKTLSHERAILVQGFMSSASFFYPPYSRLSRQVLSVLKKIWT